MHSAEDDPAESTESVGEPAVRESLPDEAMLYCPVCSRRLIARRCKLICEQCGYFMSCADYY